jgi:hypothetical protein
MIGSAMYDTTPNDKVLIQITQWLPDTPENESFLRRERERILKSDPTSLPEIRLNPQFEAAWWALFRWVAPELLGDDLKRWLPDLRGPGKRKRARD